MADVGTSHLGQMLTFALQHLLLTGVTDSAIAPPRAFQALVAVGI
jgi:hypothetical protein